MKCLTCGKNFKPRSYNQKFCSNKGKYNCKDRYNNKHRFKVSEARLRYLGFESEIQYIKQKFIYCDFEDDF